MTAVMTMILGDMLLLGLEIWLTPWGLGATAILLVLFALLGLIFGAVRMLQVAGGLAFLSALFILSQAGQSAFGSGLMLYLIPTQYALAVAAAGAFVIDFVRMRS